MAAVQQSHCECIDTDGMERLRYFPRRLLTVDDMRTEQDYFREKHRRHNRLVHGYGVVCGLEVVRNTSSNSTTAITICPGYALGPWGDEIYVEQPAPFDLARCMRDDGKPCQPQPEVQPVGGQVVRLLVKIRYAECPGRPMRTPAAGCGCNETACEYSRVRDSFEIHCMLKPDPPTAPTPVVGADSHIPLCMRCPEDPWLVLAEVQLDANGAMVIDNSMRRLVPNTPSTVAESS